MCFSLSDSLKNWAFYSGRNAPFFYHISTNISVFCIKLQLKTSERKRTEEDNLRRRRRNRRTQKVILVITLILMHHTCYYYLHLTSNTYHLSKENSALAFCPEVQRGDSKYLCHAHLSSFPLINQSACSIRAARLSACFKVAASIMKKHTEQLS